MTATRYSLSFTTGALFYHESMQLSALQASLRLWDKVRNAVIAENLIQARTINTLKRVTSEIISRLKTLNEAEMAFLNNAEYAEQRLILWLAICRRYPFIADFAVSVLHNNFISLKKNLTQADYDIFFNQKTLWHGELDQIAPATKRKLRQTLFKMMLEAHILDNKNGIIPMVPSAAFQAILARAEQQEAMFFPLMDL